MYTKFFGFKESPFNPSPDPKFLYLTRSHREALASMVYGIEQRRGFIAIMGEVGSGKTTLIHSLISNLDNKTETAFIFYPSGTYSDLLRNILLEFNIDSKGENNFDMQVKFHHFVIDQFRRGGNVAIIFDEAQNMSPEVLEQLRLLSNLEAPEEKLFQIILVGQPELSNKLNQPELRQIRQRIGIRREIEPLADPEVRSYIEHRLKVAGYKGRLKLFSEKALDLICHYSRGIPRMVNILCDNSLLIAYGLSKRKIDESIIKEVLADLKIEQSIEEKIPGVEHPIAHYPTSKPLNRRLWIRATLLSVLLFLTIFLIQGDGQIGAIKRYISKVVPVSKKMGMLLSTFKNKVKENPQVTMVPPVEEKPLSLAFPTEGKGVPLLAGNKNKVKENPQVAMVSSVEERPLSLTLPIEPREIYFANRHYQIGDDALPVLSKLALAIKKSPEAEVIIEGHTDSIGDEEFNKWLSMARAQSVKQWLIDHAGIDGFRLHVRGLAESRPKDSNDTDEGRRRNRRVEVIIR